MPRSTREWAKRKLDESVQNIDWAGTHINEVIERYKAEHPEVSDPLSNCQDMLVMVQDVIKKVRSSF